MSSKPRSRRSTRKDPWDENVLMTSSKSKLIDLDLVKILANPEAWHCLDEDEKKQILHLLPKHTHPAADTAASEPDAKIPPLPHEFLRYSNNWRGGVRQLQVDLECGRYDPEWLSQADEAMKQRADGKFDKWKDKEFEEFWGQKQKLYRESYAGEATQVKLETLVEQDVIRKGDVWTYARAFVVGGDKGSYAQAFFIGEKGEKSNVLVEKEVKVVDVVGSSLTFAVPAGQRVIFPHHVEIPEERLAVVKPTKSTKPARRRRPRPETSTRTIPQRETRASKRRSSTEEEGARKKRQIEREGVMNTNDGLFSNEEGIQKPVPEGDNDSALASDTKATEVDGPPAGETQSSEATEQPESREPEDPGQTAESIETKEQQAAETEAQAVQPEVTERQPKKEQPKEELLKEEPDQPIPESAENPSEPQPPSSSQDELVILPNITMPSILEKHILAIDGRFKGVRSVNAWKAIRCHRNNQDMGSLWEVRQDWYLKHDQ